MEFRILTDINQQRGAQAKRSCIYVYIHIDVDCTLAREKGWGVLFSKDTET